MQYSRLASSRSVFPKLGSSELQGSAKACRGFRDSKMPNGGEVLLAVLNLQERTKFYVATFDTHHSVTGSTRSVNRCFNPEFS
jgi:hypothetical protein